MTANSATTALQPKRRHRWSQWQLRTLVVLMLLGCIGFRWLGGQIQRGRDQRRARSAISQLGGECIALTYLEWGELLFGEDFGLDVIAVLFPDDSTVTDAGLVHLNGLPRLGSLSLQGTQISDAGLSHLANLNQLRELNLSDTKITDAGLIHLRRLVQLESLDLSGTQVTKAGVSALYRTLGPRVFIHHQDDPEPDAPMAQQRPATRGSTTLGSTTLGPTNGGNARPFVARP